METRRPGLLEVGGLVAFAAILWRPVSNNQVLLPLLAVLTMVAVLRAARRGQWIHPALFPVVIAQVAIALLGTTVGWANSNPGLVSGILVYVAAPVIWWSWVAAHDLAALRRTLNVIVGVTIAISVAIILFSFAQQGVIPSVLPAGLLQGQGAGFGQGVGSTEVRFFGLSTLTASAPACAAIALTPANRWLPSRPLAAAAAVFSAIAILVAGRRAQVVVFLLAPLIAWLVMRAIGARPSRAARRRGPLPRWLLLTYAGTGAIAFAAATGAVSIRIVTLSFQSAVKVLSGSAGSADDAVRVEQSRQLLRAWEGSPLAGRGFGAVIDGYQRSAERPWNFELQYHLFLFQTGLLGAIALIGLVIAVVGAVRRLAARAEEYRPLLVVSLTAAISMALANASNPYLQAPGHMWPMYLPLVVLNVGWRLLRQRHGDGQREQAKADELQPLPGQEPPALGLLIGSKIHRPEA